MKLINLQIFPKGVNGWGSDLLVFGNDITQLFGPNGCGKTPLVQSIVYCLGYPCVFRQDIYDHCHSARLKIDTKKGYLFITRIYLKNEFEVEVVDPLGALRVFYNEADYSSFIFDWLDFSVQNLVSNTNIQTQPYLSTVLPFFYINQDKGYSRVYSPEKNFIKDQFSEMVRFLFELPIKNSFDEKKEKILAKEKLNILDKQVEEHRRQLENAKLIISNNESVQSAESLRQEIDFLETEIENLKSAGADKNQAVTAIDKLITSNMNLIASIDNHVSEIKNRTNGINRIIDEINTEINTLTLNENARRVFLSFEEICSSVGCKLFSSSSDSYVKNLLYLKDQIKDLERNRDKDLNKVLNLDSEKNNYTRIIDDLIRERNSTLSKSEIRSIVDIISEFKDKIFNLNNKLSELEQLEYFEQKYSKVQKQREKAIEEYNSFSSSEKKAIPSILKIKTGLRENLIKWLSILRTKNISLDISFPNDFTPVLGVEPVHHLTGSTLIRAVLAFHASMIELLFDNNKNNFGFLIFDTPKQHEIHDDDLDNYMHELKKLCNKYSIQIIFSTTEYHYVGDDRDAEWIPIHAGKEQNMFLFTLI